MTRDEHLEWAKQRALEYLPDNPLEAMTSMGSDLNKHPRRPNAPGEYRRQISLEYRRQ
jgi:hypothetical protein